MSAGGTHGDLWARTVLESVWTGAPKTPAALQAVQAIGRLESNYGYPEGDSEWSASHNWGAVQEPHPTAENSFEHFDRNAAGQVYVGHFKRYPTDEAGASDFLHELVRRPSVLAVLGSGSATAIATAMHDTHYFEAKPTDYANAIVRNAAAIAKSLKELAYVTLFGPGLVASTGDGLGVLVLASLCYLAWRSRA